MRSQPIKRVVDARISQQRYILHLICGHNISLIEIQLQAAPHAAEALGTATHWDCPYCPDHPEPKPEGPTAQQLWKQAGEP